MAGKREVCEQPLELIPRHDQREADENEWMNGWIDGWMDCCKLRLSLRDKARILYLQRELVDLASPAVQQNQTGAEWDRCKLTDGSARNRHA